MPDFSDQEFMARPLGEINAKILLERNYEVLTATELLVSDVELNRNDYRHRARYKGSLYALFLDMLSLLRRSSLSKDEIASLEQQVSHPDLSQNFAAYRVLERILDEKGVKRVDVFKQEQKPGENVL